MADRTYVVRLKAPNRTIQHVDASSVEIHGDHVVFLSSEGKLAALFLMDIVQSWDVLR